MDAGLFLSRSRMVHGTRDDGDQRMRAALESTVGMELGLTSGSLESVSTAGGGTLRATGVHRRADIESRLNEAAVMGLREESVSPSPALQVYDFAAKGAYDSTTKDLAVDSLAEEVRWVVWAVSPVVERCG
jgi:hypothetical protein